MALEFTASFLTDSIALYRKYKELAEGAMKQVRDEDLFAHIDAESNTLATVVRHMAGNMLSRWTDFLSTDGEKPWRNRDAEFADVTQSREALMEIWERGWACTLAALEGLTDDDLGRRVSIRGEAHSVLQAINRQMAHYAYHVGQIVMLAKHFQSGEWKPLTIPKNKPDRFNRAVPAGELGQR
jgi:uncharacterized damage-inducible protein DinB